MCLFVAIAGLGFAADGAKQIKKAFDLPADSADRSLKLFSQQSGLEVLFPPEIARRVRTQPVKGELTARDALATLLAGTGLVGVEDKTGAFSVRRENPVPNAPRATRPTASDRPLPNAPVKAASGPTARSSA
ncbi:MAG: STN domain-containing protein, partial [Opitutaceae bacterium]